jgi:hypothetical protein
VRTLIAWLDTDWDREKFAALLIAPPTPTNLLAGVFIGSLIVVVVRATGH